VLSPFIHRELLFQQSFFVQLLYRIVQYSPEEFIAEWATIWMSEIMEIFYRPNATVAFE
jgi:hypothetical protein